MTYSEWFWTECDTLCSDTDFTYRFANKCWDFRQKEVDELAQALIKEQEEVLKYKPVYLKLIAENITLKEKFNELLKEATSSNRLSSFTVISILEGL